MSHFFCSTPRESSAQRSPRRARRSTVPMALAIVLGTFCVISPAGSALYKWTDANGRVVYSDQPPPGDVKVERINAPPPPANPDAVKEMANKEAEGKKQQADAAENAKKAAQTRADAQKRASWCKDARAELTALSSDQLLVAKVTEKGPVYLDDAERRRRREALESNLRANNCPPG